MENITYQEFWNDCRSLAKLVDWRKYDKICPIVRGGVNVGILLSSWTGVPLEAFAEGNRSLIVDDLVDSGKTIEHFEGFDTAVLYRKPHSPKTTYCVREIDDWIALPYEQTDRDIEDTIVRQLEFIGENPLREGLKETPQRIIHSWETLYGGYGADYKEILSKTFTQEYDEIVLLRDIELYSTCEHHMLPFFGKCHIAYIPNGKVVGISKLGRLMECYARRLQIQERLCNEIVNAIEECLKPKGSACIIEAQHFCMTSRGVQKQNSIMTTSALKGVFLEKPQAREELMRLIR